NRLAAARAASFREREHARNGRRTVKWLIESPVGKWRAIDTRCPAGPPSGNRSQPAGLVLMSRSAGGPLAPALRGAPPGASPFLVWPILLPAMRSIVRRRRYTAPRMRRHTWLDRRGKEARKRRLRTMLRIAGRTMRPHSLLRHAPRRRGIQ